MCGPVFVPADHPSGAREHASYDEFVALAATSGTGVHLCPGRFVAPADMPQPPQVYLPSGLRSLAADELPRGYGSGFFATLPLGTKSSMLLDLEAGRPLELPWLAGRIVELGRRHAVPVQANAAVVAALTPHVRAGAQP